MKRFIQYCFTLYDISTQSESLEWVDNGNSVFKNWLLRLIYRMDHQAPYDLKSKEEKRHTDKEIFFKIMPNDRVNEVLKINFTKIKA